VNRSGCGHTKPAIFNELVAVLLVLFHVALNPLLVPGLKRMYANEVIKSSQQLCTSYCDVIARAGVDGTYTTDS